MPDVHIRHHRGTKKFLGDSVAGGESTLLGLLDRIQQGIPYIRFDRWSIKKETPTTDDEHLVDFEDRRSKKILKLSLPIANRLLVCNAKSNIKPLREIERYFLNALVVEARNLLTTSTSSKALILSELGSLAAASTITKHAGPRDPPLPIIQFLQTLSRQSYENQRISYGVILRRRREYHWRRGRPRITARFSDEFENKRFKKLTDGFSTALLVDSEMEIAAVVPLLSPSEEGSVNWKRPLWLGNLAEEAKDQDGVGFALSRTGDILVCFDGELFLSQRAGRWQMWNHEAQLSAILASFNYRGASNHLRQVMSRLYSVSLDLSFRRSGALFVVLKGKRSFKEAVGENEDAENKKRQIGEQVLRERIRESKVYLTDRRVLADLASLDGAVVLDRNGTLLTYGAIVSSRGRQTEAQGARTQAALSTSKVGIAIKVSSDGDITVYHKKERVIAF